MNCQLKNAFELESLWRNEAVMVVCINLFSSFRMFSNEVSNRNAKEYERAASPRNAGQCLRERTEPVLGGKFVLGGKMLKIGEGFSQSKLILERR